MEELGPVDLAPVSVKLWDTDEVVRRLAPHRHNRSLARVITGEFSGQRSDRVMRILECFVDAGIDTELSI